ncbi:hypothetical protein [Runella sp.]
MKPINRSAKRKYQSPKLKKIGKVTTLTMKAGSTADVLTSYTP